MRLTVGDGGGSLEPLPSVVNFLIALFLKMEGQEERRPLRLCIYDGNNGYVARV